VADDAYRLLTDKEAAAALGVSVSLLRKWRFRLNEGPAFYRVGRLIRYSWGELREFLAAQQINPVGRRRPSAASDTGQMRPQGSNRCAEKH
jgi:hypothetical protein